MVELYFKEKTDLHAHTDFSDGLYSIQESIECRLEYAEIIGISDHYRYLTREGAWEKYINEIKSYRENSILREKIKIGVEFYFEDILEDIDSIAFDDLDFIIVENFESVSEVRILNDALDVLRGKFDKDIILAHPDFQIMLKTLKAKGVEEFLIYARDKSVIIEINVNSGIFYLKDNNIRENYTNKSLVASLLDDTESFICISSDAHAYEHELFENFEDAYEFFLKWRCRLFLCN